MAALTLLHLDDTYMRSSSPDARAIASSSSSSSSAPSAEGDTNATQRVELHMAHVRARITPSQLQQLLALARRVCPHWRQSPLRAPQAPARCG